MPKRSNPPLMVIRPNWKYSRPVVLTDTEFGITGPGRSHLHPRSEVGSVVSAVFWPGMHRHVFVLDRNDRLLLRLPGDVYPSEKMNQFVVALDVPVTDFPDIVTRPQPRQVPVLRGKPGFVKLTEFDEEHPGLLSVRDFKPYGDSRVLTFVFTTMAVLVVVLLVVMVIALIFFGPHERIR